jgi:hypothetical protein
LFFNFFIYFKPTHFESFSFRLHRFQKSNLSWKHWLNARFKIAHLTMMFDLNGLSENSKVFSSRFFWCQLNSTNIVCVLLWKQILCKLKLFKKRIGVVVSLFFLKIFSICKSTIEVRVHHVHFFCWHGCLYSNLSRWVNSIQFKTFFMYISKESVWFRSSYFCDDGILRR